MVYLLKYSELLCYVWTFINKQPNKNDLLIKFKDEIKSDSLNLIDKMIQLLNVFSNRTINKIDL